MPFEKKHDDQAIFAKWLSWWQRGGTQGNRTAAAFAEFANIPQNTINKRWPEYKRKASNLANAQSPLSNTDAKSNDKTESLETHGTQPNPASTGGLSLSSSQDELDGLGDDRSLLSRAKAELSDLLRSEDSATRARVALAVMKVSALEEGSTPYDGLAPTALLDRLLLLSEPPLKALWDAERGRPFLVGSVPRLSKGNTLDPDGRLERGTAE